MSPEAWRRCLVVIVCWSEHPVFRLCLRVCVLTLSLCVCGVRLVEPESGVLRIDGVDVRAMGLQDLRTHMGVIPQDPVLFKVTQARSGGRGGRRREMCL